MLDKSLNSPLALKRCKWMAEATRLERDKTREIADGREDSDKRLQRPNAIQSLHRARQTRVLWPFLGPLCEPAA